MPLCITGADAPLLDRHELGLLDVMPCVLLITFAMQGTIAAL
jgi:hypothetical protein